jgi:hypothetical protein
MFTCDEKIETRDGHRLKFSAVVGNTELAEKFFKYTPYGQLEMGTVNAEAASQFKPGKAYYLDFTPAD